MSNPILPPDSVQALLTLAYPSAQFQADCRTAALRARSHGRLRQAVRSLAAVPRNIRKFLRALANESGTSDREVAEFSGLDPDHPVDAPFAAAWGRFAAAVGLAWDQAELALGISLLEERGIQPRFGSVTGADRASPSTTSRSSARRSPALTTGSRPFRCGAARRPGRLCRVGRPRSRGTRPLRARRNEHLRPPQDRRAAGQGDRRRPGRRRDRRRRLADVTFRSSLFVSARPQCHQ